MRLAAPQLRAAMMLWLSAQAPPGTPLPHLTEPRGASLTTLPHTHQFVNLKLSEENDSWGCPPGNVKGKTRTGGGMVPTELVGTGRDPYVTLRTEGLSCPPCHLVPLLSEQPVTLTALAGSVSGPSFTARLSPWAGGLVSLGTGMGTLPHLREGSTRLR